MFVSVRKMPHEQVTALYAQHAQEVFNNAYASDFTPVIIPSCDGAEDLPATLTSLSLSKEPVLPIVIDNNSETDAGIKVAQSFGAVALSIPKGQGSKIAAIQAGLHLANEMGKSKALLTDDDTLFPTKWSRRMTNEMARHDKGRGVGVFATSITMHGESALVDLAYTMYRASRDIQRKVQGRPFSARGHNYGISLDNDGKILHAIDGIDGAIFEGDAHAVLDAIRTAGGEIRPVLSPRAAVITRGDRLSNAREALQAVFGNERSRSYRQQYGNGYTVYEH